MSRAELVFQALNFDAVELIERRRLAIHMCGLSGVGSEERERNTMAAALCAAAVILNASECERHVRVGG